VIHTVNQCDLIVIPHFLYNLFQFTIHKHAHYIHFWEIQGSNLRPDTNHPEELHGVLQSLEANAWIMPQIRP
jgi:hypothetical protein